MTTTATAHTFKRGEFAMTVGDHPERVQIVRAEFLDFPTFVGRDGETVLARRERWLHVRDADGAVLVTHPSNLTPATAPGAEHCPTHVPVTVVEHPRRYADWQGQTQGTGHVYRIDFTASNGQHLATWHQCAGRAVSEVRAYADAQAAEIVTCRCP